MINIDTITTERLRGHRPSPADLDDLVQLHGDPQVMRTLSRDGAVLSRQQTAQVLESNMGYWEHDGFGIWIFHHATTDAFVGRGGLRRTQVAGRDEVELAYAIGSAWWNQGYASEIARASLQVAFEQLDLPDVTCFTLTTNAASRRVMEKAGFRYERDVMHADLPHVFFRITATDWHAAHDS